MTLQGSLGPDESIDLLRQRGFTDDEIVDELGRYGHMALELDEAGRLRWTFGTAGTAQQQRLVREYLERTRRKPMTAYAQQKADEIRQERDYLRRTTGRVTVAGLARRIGVDRGTLQAWIDEGWFTLD